MREKSNWVIHAETESEAARTGKGINRLCFKTFSTVRKKKKKKHCQATAAVVLHKARHCVFTSLEGVSISAESLQDGCRAAKLTLIFTRAASTPPGCPAMDTCAQ